jgi:nicotinate-nucleotide adenylyltransferase
MIVGRTLGLLGGTFDPVHYGHLDAAEAARAALALDEVVFIPTHDPPHKPNDPHATAFHRFALASLAANDRPWMRVSDIELAREGQSYTADGWLPSQLFFILGADAFAEIATWYQFPAVLEAAHFVVIARPGTTIDGALARVPALRARAFTPSAFDRVVGRVASLTTGTTRILLVEAHTRDVSSTTIRKRLAAHQTIDDLVPAGVARHIFAHHLYGAVGRLHDENQTARS